MPVLLMFAIACSPMSVSGAYGNPIPDDTTTSQQWLAHAAISFALRQTWFTMMLHPRGYDGND